MANVVEALLRSRFVDEASKGIEHTKALLERDFRDMQNASQLFGAGVGGSLDKAAGALSGWENQLRRAAVESKSEFAAMGLGAAALGVAVASGLLMAGRAAANWGIELAKEASEVVELKYTYEGLIATTGREADLVARLKRETEGLVSGKELLKNANRLLQSGIKVTNDQYVELTGNVYKLSKASGGDQVQALGAVTDALVKGNARGLQAIGVHLAVKDAVSEMAMASGEATSKLKDSAKVQAFYTEILEETRKAALLLPPDFVSLKDAIERGEKAWRTYFLIIGEGILRSKVLQELLQKFVGAINEMGTSQQLIDNIALATNRMFLAFLNGAANVLDMLALVAPAAELFGIAFERALAGPIREVTAVIEFNARGVMLLLDALAKLPGEGGKHFQELSERLWLWTRDVERANRSAKAAFDWSGLKASDQLGELADKTRRLASYMEAYSGEVVKGKAGTTGIGDAAAGAALDLKKLNDQLRAAEDLFFRLSAGGLTPFQKSLLDLQKNIEDVNRLDLSAVASQAERDRIREELRAAAIEASNREIAKIQEEENDRELAIYDRHTLELIKMQKERRRRMAEEVGRQPDDTFQRAAREERAAALGTMQEVERRLREQMSRPGSGAQKNEWLAPLMDAGNQMRELNKLGMDPFHQTLHGMKQGVMDFGSQAGGAIASFFADWASGQENAGKKLAGAFLGMIGQMISNTGKYVFALGFAEFILGLTAIGRMNQHSAVAGLKAMAVGGLMLAGGGLLQGAGSSLGGTNNAGSGGSFQQSTPRPSSPTTQIVNLANASGQQQAAQSTKPVEVVLRVEPKAGFMASEISRSVRANDPRVRLSLVTASE